MWGAGSIATSRRTTSSSTCGTRPPAACRPPAAAVPCLGGKCAGRPSPIPGPTSPRMGIRDSLGLLAGPSRCWDTTHARVHTCNTARAHTVMVELCADYSKDGMIQHGIGNTTRQEPAHSHTMQYRMDTKAVSG